MKVPDNLIPLVYLGVVGVMAALLQFASVPAEMIGMIVGAGLTRVKMPAPSDKVH